MGFKRALRLLPALLLLIIIFLVGVSGPYQEGPWIIAPLIGSTKVELGGRRISTNSRSLTAVITKRDIASLDYFTKLETADFRGSTCYGEIAEWVAAHPEVETNYSLPLPNGSTVDALAEELDAEWMGSEELDAVLSVIPYMKNLKLMHLGEVGGDRLKLQDLMKIHDSAPGLELNFLAVVNGELLDSTAESIDLSDMRHEDATGLAMILSYMENLKTVELGSRAEGEKQIPWEDIALLKSSCPDADFRYSFRLYGRDLDLEAEKLDFRNAEVDDNGAALYSVLACMNHCTYLDMDGTDVENEELAKLRDIFPETRIVWRVWFGTNYSVRTDVERILASKPTVGGMIYDSSPLQYCTEVKYLDLGHNDGMTDLSFAAYMPKLEVLIIAMTGVTDISPLKNCSRLEYLELNSTNIGDLSPLEGHTALRHLNIGCCPNIHDISSLYGITKLERFWIGNETPVPAEQVAKMRAAAPACTINTTTTDPHGEAWRFTDYDPEIPKYYWVPRHELLREQMGYNYQEYSFYWLDPMCDLPAPPEYAGKFGKEVYGL